MRPQAITSSSPIIPIPNLPPNFREVHTCSVTACDLAAHVTELKTLQPGSSQPAHSILSFSQHAAKRVQTIAKVQDDSFWLWDANTLSLLKKLEPAVPGSSQPACRVFCVSQDGAWMVAGGTSPLLFVWDLAAAELLYALHLPFGRSVYGTSQLHFMPDSQTMAGNSAAALPAAKQQSALHQMQDMLIVMNRWVSGLGA